MPKKIAINTEKDPIIQDIKKTIEDQIKNTISVKVFKQKTVIFCKILSNININLLTTKDINLIRMLSKIYFEIILQDNDQDKSLITKEDVISIFAFFYEKWISPEYEGKLIAIIEKIQKDALSCKLAKGSHHSCEEILMCIIDNSDLQLRTSTEDSSQELSQYLNSYLITMLKSHFLAAAYKFFIKKIKPTLSKENLNILLYDIFVEILSIQDIDYLSQVVDKFKIDFKNYWLKIKGSDNTEIEGSVVTIVFNLKFKEQYMMFLQKHRIHPDSDRDSEHFETKLQGMTALLLASNSGKLDIIKLLIKYGADINQAIPSKNNLLLSFRTPFSVAFGTGNIELIKSLVNDYGADPLKAIIKTQKALSDYTAGALSEELCTKIIPTMGGKELLNTIGNSAYEDYVYNYCDIIEHHYLKKLLNSESDLPKKLTTQKNTLSTSGAVFLPSYNEKLKNRSDFTVKDDTLSSKPISKATSDHILDETEPQHSDLSVDQELFGSYFKFKKYMSKDILKDKLRLEEEFDVLLLTYITDHSEENLKMLHDFINKNSEIKLYLMSSIINNTNDDDIENVKNILINEPNLLHKFLKLKKQYNRLSSTLPNQTVSLPEGVYKVQSTFKNPTYVAIDPTINQILREKNYNLFQKFNNQIINCKFIPANSQDLSGIKIIKGTIKLKLSNENIAIATNIKYFNQTSSMTLIIFDKIIDHKFKYTINHIETKKCEDFNDIFLKLKSKHSLVINF